NPTPPLTYVKFSPKSRLLGAGGGWSINYSKNSWYHLGLTKYQPLRQTENHTKDDGSDRTV
ncbi:MAG: hypothetical protein ACYTXY_25975, partial [Nostoc sp.]